MNQRSDVNKQGIILLPTIQSQVTQRKDKLTSNIHVSNLISTKLWLRHTDDCRHKKA
jgi:hypothetical protein